MSFVTHLECSETGKQYPPGKIYNLSDAGKPLLVRYDLEAISKSMNKADLAHRAPEFWRYRELLPIEDDKNIVCLGEVMTPILSAPKLASELDCERILIKDEGRLPTGSFKARGLAVAVSMAKELGITRMAMPTNGNAGAALAAYCTRAGIESYVFCPDDTPAVNIHEIAYQGAKTFCVNGLINDCGAIVGQGVEVMNWFDTSTLKEPYRIEGKKTMGLELAEQMDWQLPDVILYPTGGGTGLIGMWKAFDEMQSLGWIDSKRPRMVAVQAEGCAPIVKAFEEGNRHAEFWHGARTIAAGIRVPAAIGDFLILDAVRSSNGFAIAVDDEDILAAQAKAAAAEGILLCPEGAATLAALKLARSRGQIRPDETALLFNCATGLKYPMPESIRTLDISKPIDFGRLGSDE